MKYISTRGKVAPTGFLDTFMMGLGDDGGLMIPEKLPRFTPEQFRAWEQLSFQELFFEVFHPFVNGEIPDDELKALIESSYASFRDSEVTPLRRIRDQLYILELFHGPTFAFKDVALQFLGNLYSYVSKKQGKIINILGATSGDTGAAAIEGVRGKEGIRICILHPHQKVSKVQELQMTTVDDGNVLNLAVKGTFDDCQRIIKDIFADVAFKNRYHLRAVNSINFVRILAQTVYYFYAYFRIVRETPGAKVSFSVPTGNFGNILSAYLAKNMGLPIHRLVLATNENNILERFVNEGVYQPDEFRGTYSPSMDIQVASNFERYLYYLLDEDAQAVAGIMQRFRAEGKVLLDPALLGKVQADFTAYGVRNDECLRMIESYSADAGYLLDPHTACGVAAYEARPGEGETTVVLATAHPAKFDESIRLVGLKQEFPEQIRSLFDKPQHQSVVENSNGEVASRLESFFAEK